jgi:hypothetical protein
MPTPALRISTMQWTIVLSRTDQFNDWFSQPSEMPKGHLGIKYGLWTRNLSIYEDKKLVTHWRAGHQSRVGHFWADVADHFSRELQCY